MTIKYNAPVTLTFSLIAAAVLAVDFFTGTRLIPALFTVPGRGGMNLANPFDYLRLITHVLGHGSWTHLLGNLAFILLLGPILEEKHGAKAVIIMMILTALATGLLNVIFLTTGLLGASGVVFMMILLVSFTNIRQGEIPLTFILVLLLYLVRELVSAFEHNDVSEFAHIVGGLCGSLFGFFAPRKA